MKKLCVMVSILASFIFAAALHGQSLTEKEIAGLRGSLAKDTPTTAVRNALSAQSDIRSLTLNRELQGQDDHYFKYRVDVRGITNQKSSGRCWMFTSLNVLRPSVMEKYDVADFDFSHVYLYFWDILEKSNLFLENVVATAKKPMDDREVVHYFASPVNDGGVWNLFYNIAGKYGVVPKSVMPETAHSENTGQMISLICEKLRMEGYALREMAADKKQAKNVPARKQEVLKEIYRMLSLCLGEPPTEFTWRYTDKKGGIVSHTYTPLEFYKEIIPGDYSPADYIMIMNDPTREYYKLYEIQNYRNTVEGVNWLYLNLPNDAIKRAALASIKNNEAMYASCDVGKQHNRTTGIMDTEMYDYESLLGVKLGMDKKARILTRQSGSSHAMLLMACDTDADDKPVKWQFENSWGSSAGHNGYLTFTDRWFDEYMFRVVIHRRYLDERSLAALDQKPVTLPPWDYMN